MKRATKPRIRVTAAIDESLVIWMDEKIIKGIYRNRTHAIEGCIRQAKGND